MKGLFDFAEINRAALAALPTVLARILPGGSRRGNEYVVRNPRRNDQSPGSFCINLSSGKWADFACDAEEAIRFHFRGATRKWDKHCAG
jgi:hypothetical protein